MSEPSLLLPGKEDYCNYYSMIMKKEMVQYDYRDVDGELFSCVTKDLEEARSKKEEWLKNKS